MAWARARRLRTGTFWYLVTDQRKEHPAGKGKEGRELARQWAVELNRAKRAEKAGFPDEEAPRRCLWTLATLRSVDLEEARRRGLRTVQPQLQGRLSKRESHWNALLAFFGADTNLDAITGERIRAFIESRERDGAGPAAINRDLAILKTALGIARARNESGYCGTPFASIQSLEERPSRRKPIALDAKDAARLVAICWKLDRAFGAYVELLLLTASRLNERAELSGAFLRYPSYKRGRPRTFRLRGRLTEIVTFDRSFSRRLWKQAVAVLKRPELRPHDLRHTALTLAGKRPNASLDSLTKLGGWQSAAMADRYLHPDRRAIDAVTLGGSAERGRNRKTAGEPRKRASH